MQPIPYFGEKLGSIVLKRIDSFYRLGKEAPEATHYWRKIKGGG